MRVPTPFERRLDAWVHLLAIGLTIPAALALLALARRDGWQEAMVAGVYGMSALVMFTVSFAYHHWARGVQKAWFRRYDHAAIFLMIAGTYTPYMMISIGGLFGQLWLLLVWVLALGGIIQRLRRALDAADAPVWPYLALGWISLPLLGVLISELSSSALAYLVLGGIVYTTGVIFYLWQSLPYQNVIWHGFVLLGAACHYFSIRDVLVAA